MLKFTKSPDAVAKLSREQYRVTQECCTFHFVRPDRTLPVRTDKASMHR